LGGKANVEVVRGKGHEEVPEFFESERLLDFLLRFLSPRTHQTSSVRPCLLDAVGPPYGGSACWLESG
jgi:hypothetical protein